jgi:oxysterol-binding protein-related protein 8
MNGETRIYFIDHPGEEYILTYPNIYARGLLFGTTFLEIGDDSTIKCTNSDFVAEINFKVKVYIFIYFQNILI